MDGSIYTGVESNIMTTAGKDKWGPRAWRALHVTAVDYAAQPTRAEKAAAYSWLWRFARALPCGECRAHATAYIGQYPPDLAGSRELQNWAWRFHNAVNARLKKPLMTAEEYANTYRDDLNKKYREYL